MQLTNTAMCHGNKVRSSKTIRYKAENPQHANAVPYNRSKYKQDFRNYED